MTEAASEAVTIAFTTAEAAGPTARVAPGGTLLEAARSAGAEITTTCGGRGRCRSCRVKFVQGSVPPFTIMDTVQLGHDEVHEGFRLACQTRINADCRVMVAPPLVEGGHQILAAVAGPASTSCTGLDSGVEKWLVTARRPSDENHQTSDLEEILSAWGRLPAGAVSRDVIAKAPAALRDQAGVLTLTSFNDEIIDLEAGDSTAERYGMAFDIGTTSIVGSLMDLASGEVLASFGGMNPQAVFGGDLMSRIAFAQFKPEALRKLRARVLGAVNGFVKEACAEAGVSPSHVYKVVIVGNTCMHHIFLGIDPTYVGLAPYAPVIRDPIVVSAKEALLKLNPGARVCFLPIVAGFVGADTMAVILATRIHEGDRVRMVVDIGTNGEGVMSAHGRLMAYSAPAGPALEGAQIRHGMRGAMGAIETVTIDADVHCGVIGNAPAMGICGSGLIDGIAKMLDARVLNPSGRLRPDADAPLPPALRERLLDADGSPEFALVWAAESGKGENVTLTQQDIRQFQLAKGAIYSGILLLQKIMGVPDEAIEELMLAGAFGNYVNIASAVRVRLLPPLPLERIAYVGNAALLGAQMALLSETERARAATLARKIEHVALAKRPDFQDIFVHAVGFPAADAAGAVPAMSA